MCQLSANLPQISNTISSNLLHSGSFLQLFFFFFKEIAWLYLFISNIYLFIYLFLALLGLRFCARALSSWWQAGATLHRGARASHHRGLPCCGAQAPDAQAQQLWLTGSAAPRHAGSSQTRARTRVPCTGRQILNHCATREALSNYLCVSKATSA